MEKFTLGIEFKAKILSLWQSECVFVKVCVCLFSPSLGLEKRTSGSSQMVPSLRRTAVAVV